MAKDALSRGINLWWQDGELLAEITDPAPARQNRKTRLSVEQRKARPGTGRGPHQDGEQNSASQLGTACIDLE